MKDIKKVDISHAQNHEESTSANVRLGGYKMYEHCPTNEVQCYRVVLEDKDIDRIFLLNEVTFVKLTTGQTFKLSDLTHDAKTLNRVNSFLKDGVDLRSHPGLELILVCEDLDTGSLTTIDGNHRLMAHYLTFGSVQEVPAYVYIHTNMNKWYFIPPLARHNP
jgi:hypothetical protein